MTFDKFLGRLDSQRISCQEVALADGYFVNIIHSDRICVSIFCVVIKKNVQK